MSMLDVRISELASETDKHLLRSSQPLGWLGLAREMLRGRLGRLVWVIVIAEILALIAAIWTAIVFFNTADVMVAVKYGLSAAVLALIVVVLQATLQAQMQTERVMRGLKRIEILILAQRQ